VLEVLVGKRTEVSVERLLEQLCPRLPCVPELITTDAYPAYEAALEAFFAEAVTPERTGRPGRPRGPVPVWPPELCYATVGKRRRGGRVVAVEARVVHGELAPGQGVSTSYPERQHGTDRHRNARKARKGYRFSKDWEVHEAVTTFTMFSYNFCWPVRTLRQQTDSGRYQQRTPAMAAGLTDHVWSLREWIIFPGAQR
jgi:IS1 family transposase